MPVAISFALSETRWLRRTVPPASLNRERDDQKGETGADLLKLTGNAFGRRGFNDGIRFVDRLVADRPHVICA
jgi:hypothetical protein